MTTKEMRVRDLDFNLTYVYLRDKETDEWKFWAFHYEENVEEFLMMLSADYPNTRYECGTVDGDLKIIVEE